MAIGLCVAVKWQLNIAPHKCCVLHVGRNNIKHEYNMHNNELGNATEVVDLGVTVDSNTRFDKHINKMVTKAHQRAALKLLDVLRVKNPMFCLEVIVLEVIILD